MSDNYDSDFESFLQNGASEGVQHTGRPYGSTQDSPRPLPKKVDRRSSSKEPDQPTGTSSGVTRTKVPSVRAPPKKYNDAKPSITKKSRPRNENKSGSDRVSPASTARPRILSASRNQIYSLTNMIEELRREVDALTRDNKELRRIKNIQEREIERLDGEESQLSVVLVKHNTEVRGLQDANKKYKEQLDKLGEVLKRKDAALLKLQDRNRHLEDIAKNQELEERELLVRKLERTEEIVEEREKRILELEKAIKLVDKAKQNEVKILSDKLKKSKDEIKQLQETNASLECRVKEKEKLLSLNNIHYNGLPAMLRRPESETELNFVQTSRSTTGVASELPTSSTHQFPDTKISHNHSLSANLISSKIKSTRAAPSRNMPDHFSAAKTTSSQQKVSATPAAQLSSVTPPPMDPFTLNSPLPSITDLGDVPSSPTTHAHAQILSSNETSPRSKASTERDFPPGSLIETTPSRPTSNPLVSSYVEPTSTASMSSTCTPLTMTAGQKTMLLSKLNAIDAMNDIPLTSSMKATTAKSVERDAVVQVGVEHQVTKHGPSRREKPIWLSDTRSAVDRKPDSHQSPSWLEDQLRLSGQQGAKVAIPTKGSSAQNSSDPFNGFDTVKRVPSSDSDAMFGEDLFGIQSKGSAGKRHSENPADGLERRPELGQAFIRRTSSPDDVEEFVL